MQYTHAVVAITESANVDLNTILQSLQAEQYVGFINLPADLNDWLPEMCIFKNPNISV